MSYVWNDKDYKLTLTLLIFQSDTKPTNYNFSCATWVNFTTTTGYKWAGVLQSPPLRADALTS